MLMLISIDVGSVCVCVCVCVMWGASQGGISPHFFAWGGGGGNGMFVPPHTLLTPHVYFSLELCH